MNYFEFHIGDYTEATAHLSFVEDAALSRLIRKIYATEKPLPADVKAIERLVGARSRDELRAVHTVLEEFFTLCSDGWRNKRCDEELVRFNGKKEKARRSANVRWDAMRSHSEHYANALPTQCEGNALQSPVTRLQSPDPKSEERARDPVEMRTQCERISEVPHGTSDAGTALTGMSGAEETLEEHRNAWRDVDGCDSAAMEAWLLVWSRVHGDREMPSHQRIATAKLMAGLGDAATQMRAVLTAEANGWKALRHGDGRKPPPRKGDIDLEAKADAETRAWTDLQSRAKRVDYRQPREREDIGDYRVCLERAEDKAKDAAYRRGLEKKGPQSAAELLAGQQRARA